MTRRILAFTVLCLLSLAAQETGSLIAPPVIPNRWDQLKQYLVLTEAQVLSLDQVRQNRMQQEQAIYRQVSEKQREMYGLLQQGSNDAATIGRLMVEINNLNRQLPLKGDTYRTEVLAILTPQQKAKLPALVDAMKLQAAGWQAVELNMIDNPNVPDVRILPAPLNSISSMSEVLNLKAADALRNVR